MLRMEGSVTTGEKLMRKLAETGMSMRGLARESGVSYNTVKRCVTGDRRGSLDTWMRLADAIGCEVSDIIR